MYCDSQVPDVQSDQIFDIGKLRDEIEKEYSRFGLSLALELAIGGFRDTNKYLTEKQPWHMKDDQDKERKIVVRSILEAIYYLTHLLFPVLPKAASTIFEKLNTQPSHLRLLSVQFDNLKPGTKIEVGNILFEKLQPTNNNNLQSKAQPAKGGFPADLRGGVIQEVKNHPTDENLYVLVVSIGEEKRQVVARLKEFYSPEELNQREVICLCNLPPAEIRGTKSEGMILIAETKKTKTKNSITKLLECSVKNHPKWKGASIQVKGLPTTIREEPLTLKEFQKLEFKVNKEGAVLFGDLPLVALDNYPITAPLEGPAKIK